MASQSAATHAAWAAGGHAVAGAHAGLGGVALGGGGGLAHLVVRLIVWRLIWRVGFMLWRIHLFGPYIVLLIVAVLVALAVLRSRRGGGPGARGRDPVSRAAGAATVPSGTAPMTRQARATGDLRATVPSDPPSRQTTGRSDHGAVVRA